MYLRTGKVDAVMKNELAGVKNGVELYVPVPENENEERELKLREERFGNLLRDIILKYYSRIEDKMNND